MYFYQQSEPNLWTTGYYAPDGKWVPDEDYHSPEEAAARVHYLNGGREIRAQHEADAAKCRAGTCRCFSPVMEGE